MKRYKIFKSFTLAEVLITLVIIGVVAALTIPNLMQKYTEQTTVKKVQKFYSTLSNAYSLAMKENGPANEWGLKYHYDGESAEKVFELLIKPYFKISKNCGISGTGNCFGNEYKTLNNIVVGNYNQGGGMYKFKLDDGAAILVYTTAAEDFVRVLYDTNGAREPNQWGRDLFAIDIKNNKVIPSGVPPSTYDFNSTCRRSSYGYGYGYGCAAWVIYKGNMDYLHCTGLTWNSRSCKDK